MAELFADFDLDRRAPRAQSMLRTLGGSIALHALFILALIYVPVVLEMFGLASTLSGLRFVSEKYKKTEVGERATIVNIADTKLYYPRDYFLPPGALAQVEPTPVDVKLVSEFKRPKPTPTPTPTPSPSPTPAPSPVASSEVAANKAAAPGASPSASPSASPAP